MAQKQGEPKTDNLPPTALSRPPVAVLLIEDDPDDELLVRESLTETKGGKFIVEWAESLEKGLERLQEGGIDVVLLDLSLPDSSGTETFRQVYAQSPGVPIVLLTGLEDEELGAELVRAGGQDYLVKGQVNGASLTRCINYAIERKMWMELEGRRKEIEASEVRLRQIVEKISDGIVIVDENKTVHFVNPAAEVLFDRKEEKLVGQPFGFPVVVDEATEVIILGKNKVARVAEMRVVETEWGSENVYLISMRDITELKQASKKLKALANFTSENPNPVLRLARDGTILFANQSSRPLMEFWGCETGQQLSPDWCKLVNESSLSGLSKEIKVVCGNTTYSLILAPILHAGYVNVYGRDVTERLRGE